MAKYTARGRDLKERSSSSLAGASSAPQTEPSSTTELLAVPGSSFGRFPPRYPAFLELIVRIVWSQESK